VAEICRSAGSPTESTISTSITRKVSSAASSSASSRRYGGQSPRWRTEPQGEVGGLQFALLDFTAKHPELVAVFRKASIAFSSTSAASPNLYSGPLGSARARDRTARYLFALAASFLRGEALLQGSLIEPAAVEEILEQGLFPGLAFDPERVFGGTVTPLPIDLARPPASASSMRESGSSASRAISRPTSTRYGCGRPLRGGLLHLLREQGRILRRAHRPRGKDVRASSPATWTGASIASSGAAGHLLFLVFLSIDKHCYAIVREAEFVSRGGQGILRAFVAGYRKNPRATAGSKAGGRARKLPSNSSSAWPTTSASRSLRRVPGHARAIVETIGRYLARFSPISFSGGGQHGRAVRIAGTGLYAPGEPIGNEELKVLAGVEFDSDKLESKLGICSGI